MVSASILEIIMLSIMYIYETKEGKNQLQSSLNTPSFAIISFKWLMSRNPSSFFFVLSLSFFFGPFL